MAPLRTSLNIHSFKKASSWILCFISALSTVAARQCYSRNGDLEVRDTPCNPSAKESICCGAGWACLENGLCGTTVFLAGSQREFGRGSCTDQSWASNECPVCRGRDTGQVVNQCDEHTYCCENSGCSCGNETRAGTGTVFLQGDASPFTTINIPESTSASTFVTTLSTFVSAGVLPPLSSSTSQPPSSTAVLSSSTPSSTPVLSSSEPDDSVKIGVGVGVGVSVFILTIAALIYYGLRRERRLLNHMNAMLFHSYPAKLSQDNVPLHPYELMPTSNSPAQELSSNPPPRELPTY